MNGKKILIVEDNPDIRLTVRLSLQSFGFAVQEAASAEEALPLIASGELDLVLLDVTLPRMDGWDLLARIRGNDDDGVPVVMLTGHVGDDIASRAAALGANGVLSKPFEVNELAHAVEQAIAVREP